MAKAISTGLYDLMVYSYRLVLFVLFGNPLSMVFLNLLWPRHTAIFAKNSHIFGMKIYAYYERLALKWPFYWARWWMKLENLSQYSVKQQVKYLFGVAFPNGTEVEAFKAMQGKFFWPDVYDELFYKYGRWVLPLRHRDSANCKNMPKWYHHYVAEFMMQNVRLSGDALKYMIDWAAEDYNVRLSLKEYLASGKLNDAQFHILLEAVAKDPSGENDPTGAYEHMFDLLIDCIRRYGFSKEQMVYVQGHYPQEFVAIVDKESMIYWQTKELKAFKDTDEGRAAWRKFCKETPEIPVEVQRLMSLRQYCIFHNVGRKLAPEALKAFLCRSDEKLWQAVFKKEKTACASGEIREFIRKNTSLELAYRDALVEDALTAK